MPIDIPYFRRLIWALYRLTAELEAMFPGRSFPVSGELPDRLAESMAECFYGVQLQPTEENPEPHDDLLVKAAQGGRIWLQGCPKHLLVLRLYKNGAFDEVYNGPGQVVWESIPPDAKRDRTGGCAVALSVLRQLMSEVPSSMRLQRSAHSGQEGIRAASRLL